MSSQINDEINKEKENISSSITEIKSKEAKIESKMEKLEGEYPNNYFELPIYTKLEKQLASLQSQLASLQSQFASLQSQLASLQIQLVESEKRRTLIETTLQTQLVESEKRRTLHETELLHQRDHERALSIESAKQSTKSLSESSASPIAISTLNTDQVDRLLDLFPEKPKLVIFEFPKINIATNTPIPRFNWPKYNKKLCAEKDCYDAAIQYFRSSLEICGIFFGEKGFKLTNCSDRIIYNATFHESLSIRGTMDFHITAYLNSDFDSSSVRVGFEVKSPNEFAILLDKKQNHQVIGLLFAGNYCSTHPYLMIFTDCTRFQVFQMRGKSIFVSRVLFHEEAFPTIAAWLNVCSTDAEYSWINDKTHPFSEDVIEPMKFLYETYKVPIIHSFREKFIHDLQVFEEADKDLSHIERIQNLSHYFNQFFNCD